MIITQESHLDHELTAAQVRYLKEHFRDRTAFFIETVKLPQELGTVPCNLHGPATGEAPVLDAECIYRRRGERTWVSRVCKRPPVETREVTVVAGPHEGKLCVLFTAYGGPQAPREVGDPELPESELAASEAFWLTHALGVSS